jgi:hypothetical protein
MLKRVSTCFCLLIGLLETKPDALVSTLGEDSAFFCVFFGSGCRLKTAAVETYLVGGASACAVACCLRDALVPRPE